jgi:hypothetical protein
MPLHWPASMTAPPSANRGFGSAARARPAYIAFLEDMGG